MEKGVAEGAHGTHGIVHAVDLMWFPNRYECLLLNRELNPLLHALSQLFLRICTYRTQFFLPPWRLIFLNRFWHLTLHERTSTPVSAALLLFLYDFTGVDARSCKQFLKTFG